MLGTRPYDTLIIPNMKLTADDAESLLGPTRYRKLVDKLNYLTVTSLDISFPVSVVNLVYVIPSRFSLGCSAAS